MKIRKKNAPASLFMVLIVMVHLQCFCFQSFGIC